MRPALVPIILAPPGWLPRANGVPASLFADFAAGRYWAGRRQSDLNSWLSQISGTFTRASAATYFNSAGLLATAASGAARFDYDPVTKVARGFLPEGARTNVVLWNRDLTNAAWTKTSITAALDQTGIDGVAASASSLTATAGNGTCLQAITLASAACYQSAYVKRLTGSGTINMTMDNGSTWTAIVPTASWTALEIPTQTLANPTVGFRIVTSGDAIAVDYVQNENGAFRSSAIGVTTVAVARAADTLTATPGSLFNSSAGTIVAVTNKTSPATGTFLSLSNSTSERFEAYQTAAGVGGITEIAANVVGPNNNYGVANLGANKFAFSYVSGAIPNGSLNGPIEAVGSANYTAPNLATLAVGSRVAFSDQFWFGTIASLAIFKNAASNAELQRLAS
jgi:hypothetical protein